MPTEYSSGGSRSKGAITKTGNAPARRLLIEAVVANTAIARELAGWCWSLAVLE